MIRVRAKHWLNHNGVWHKWGEVFEVEENEFDGLKDCVSKVNDGFVSDVFPPVDEEKAKEPEKPKRRGRPKKTESD